VEYHGLTAEHRVLRTQSALADSFAARGKPDRSHLAVHSADARDEWREVDVIVLLPDRCRAMLFRGERMNETHSLRACEEPLRDVNTAGAFDGDNQITAHLQRAALSCAARSSSGPLCSTVVADKNFA